MLLRTYYNVMSKLSDWNSSTRTMVHVYMYSSTCTLYTYVRTYVPVSVRCHNTYVPYVRTRLPCMVLHAYDEYHGTSVLHVYVP
jgi:hypothetical protein